MPLRHNLLRLVFCSRSTATSGSALARDLASISAASQAHNPGTGIAGVLATANGVYLQWLEGPTAAVRALYQRIERDPRHEEITLLADTALEQRGLSSWSSCSIERSEPPAATRQRLLHLKQHLRQDPKARVQDFFRYLLAPSARASSAAPARRADGVMRLGLVSPGGLWAANQVQHLASSALVRTGRTSAGAAGTAAAGKPRALIEYVDLELAELGALRVMSLPADPASCQALTPLLEGLTQLVFMVGPSDVQALQTHSLEWLRDEHVRAAQPAVLLLSGMAEPDTQAVSSVLQAAWRGPVHALSIKLSDSEAAWKAMQSALLPLKPAHAPVRAGQEPAAQLRSALADSGCIEELVALEGATVAAVLGTAPADLILDSNAALAKTHQLAQWAEFLAAKQALVQRLEAGDCAEDIAVTTTTSHYVFRACRALAGVHLALVLRREGSALAAARLKLQEVEEAMQHLRL